MHSRLIQATGGLDGVRDAGLIESSLASAFTSYFGVDHYLSIEEKVARLGKMLSLMEINELIYVMLVFLELNGIVLKQTDEEIVKLGIGVVSSESDYDSILEYIRNH